MAKKFVLIGAGSRNFTTQVLRDLAECEGIAGSTIALCDLDAPTLEAVVQFAQAIIAHKQVDFTLQYSTDRNDLLPGADYVITSIQVGNDETWKLDCEIPWKYGVWQTIGDTVGPGGLSRCLRIVPVMVELAQDIEKHAPNALLLNYANPLTPISMAIREHTKVNVISMSGGRLEQRRDIFADYFGVPREEIWLLPAGPNHFVWAAELRVRGEDGYPLLRQMVKEKGVGNRPLGFKVMETYGLYPLPGDLHLAEFIPGVLAPEDNFGESFGLNNHYEWPRDVNEQRSYEDRIAKFQRATAQVAEVFAGEYVRCGAVTILDAIINDRQTFHLVNIPNNGIVDNVPANAYQEVATLVGASGFHGLKVGALPDGITRLINANLAEHALIRNAALTGDRNLALQAFLADPLCRAIGQAEQILDELLTTHAALLPRFH